MSELCCRLIRSELGDEPVREGAMTEDEMQRLKDLASRALHPARLRDTRRITESEYVDRLNVLRKQHGLWPIPPGTPVHQ